jgi:NSS family neurotransmitter:Na+ symporter
MAIFPAVFHFAAVEGIAATDLQLNGLMLMFNTLPKVFESIGYFGNIIEFFFFAMVIIAAVTSVISIMEVSTQFIIQKFKIKRKKATLFVAIITFALSIPIALSLGNLLNGTGKMEIFGLDFLTFLDTVTNTVIMPVCALFSCLAVGWFVTPKKAIEELKLDGNKFGIFEKPLMFMMKFIVPVLIIAIEVFGIKDLIFPGNVFSSDGLGVAIVSLAIIAVAMGVYFLLLKNTETGTNADEID